MRPILFRGSASSQEESVAAKTLHCPWRRQGCREERTPPKGSAEVPCAEDDAVQGRTNTPTKQPAGTNNRIAGIANDAATDRYRFARRCDTDFRVDGAGGGVRDSLHDWLLVCCLMLFTQAGFNARCPERKTRIK